jgi:hypothetical protein
MWSNPIMIRPHAMYRRKPSSFWRNFGHLVRPQLPESVQNDQTFSFFETAYRLFVTPILCMWSDHAMIRHAMIRPHAKYRPKRMAGCRRFGNGQIQFSFFLNGFSPVRDADTLHVVGSCHDPTTCKVSEQNILFWLSGAAQDAMVILVGIHVIRSGFVREMFFLIS